MKSKMYLVLLLFLFKGLVMADTVKTQIKYKESNIPVIYEKNSHLPIVTMQFVFKNSGNNYDQDKAGLASLSTGLLNEGTINLGNVKYWQKVESKAVSLSISSSSDFIVISISSLKENFPYAIKYVNELLGNINYNEETLKKLKVLTLSEIETNKSSFMYQANVLLKNITYDKPYNLPSIGTPNSIKEISLDDIQTFLQNSLTRQNLVIVAGGDIELKQAEKYSLEFVSKLDDKKPRSTMKPLHINSNKTKKIQKETKQAFIAFSAPIDIKYNSKELYKLDVMMHILGNSGFGSRLMETIRVKHGLAYSVYAHSSVDKYGSIITGGLQTGVATGSESIKLVREVIKNLTEHGATQRELDAAKKFILGSEPLKVETLNSRLSRAFANYYFDRSLDYNSEKLKEIKALTLSELNSFIKKHKEINNLNFAIVTNDSK